MTNEQRKKLIAQYAELLGESKEALRRSEGELYDLQVYIDELLDDISNYEGELEELMDTEEELD